MLCCVRLVEDLFGQGGRAREGEGGNGAGEVPGAAGGDRKLKGETGSPDEFSPSGRKRGEEET